MEEENPWLDSKSVKHINKKSVKPTYKGREGEIKKSSESVLSYQNTTQNVSQIPEREKIEQEKEKFGAVNINTLDRKDERIARFLDVLIDEFSTELPEKSKEWAISHFGADWLTLFLKDIEYLKADLKTSNFYPSADKMIFLKYIFLLNR